MIKKSQLIQIFAGVASALILASCSNEPKTEPDLTGQWELHRTGNVITIEITDEAGVLSGETVVKEGQLSQNLEVDGIRQPDGVVSLTVSLGTGIDRIEFNGVLNETGDKISGESEWWNFGFHMSDGDPSAKPEAFLANRMTSGD